MGVRAGVLVNAGSLFLQVMMNLFDVIPFEKVPVTVGCGYEVPQDVLIFLFPPFPRAALER